MNICAIIVEYNPLHKGHLYHIQKAREITQCDVLVAIMSPHFVQRGEPALFSKWERCEAVLNAGVDCVIELPTLYATQSAHVFSSISVHLANLAQANHLVFGSETNDLELLKEIASMEININHFKELMRQGEGYPKALSITSYEASANDILAIGYLKSIKDTSIVPHTIKRTNNYHSNEIHHTISSATAIRKALLSQQSVDHTIAMDSGHFKSIMEDYYPFIRYQLISKSANELKSYFLMDEGIEGLLKKNASQHEDYHQFLSACISKRYSKSRIQRIILHLYLGHLKTEVNTSEKPAKLRILGFNKIGQSYLKYLSDKEIPYATNFKHMPLSYRQSEYCATQLYALPYGIEREKKLTSQEISLTVIV